MIDIVYTWVDGNDPTWLSKRKKYIDRHVSHNLSGLIPEQKGAASTASSEVELYYSILSVRKYLTWAGRIFIVTDNQIPQRTIQKFNDIIIVDHKQIFKSQAALPNFNSCAIEIALVNIPDLSEHFIYMNDDFFINKLTSISTFYRNGLTAIFQERYLGLFKLTPETCMRWRIQRGVTTRQRYNTNSVLDHKFSKHKRPFLQHAPTYIIKSELKRCLDCFSAAVNKTLSHRFRHSQDIVPLSHLYPYFLLHSGKGFFASDVTSNLILVTNSLILNRLFYSLRNKKAHFFCLNDLRTIASEDTIVHMEKFLKIALRT